MYYLEFQLRVYLNNLKLFSIRVKGLLEPIVLPKKKRRVFALIKGIFFLEKPIFNEYNARWFYGKKCKIRKGNLLKIDYEETKCCVRQVMTIT